MADQYPECRKNHCDPYEPKTPEAAKADPFDTAVPIDWLMDLIRATHAKGGILGCIVWSYKAPHGVFGRATGLCERGRAILAAYDEVKSRTAV